MTTTMLRERDGNFQDDINIVECSYWEWDILFFSNIRFFIVSIYVLQWALCQDSHNFHSSYVITMSSSKDFDLYTFDLSIHLILIESIMLIEYVSFIHLHRPLRCVRSTGYWEKKMLISSRRLLTYISISYIDVWLFFLFHHARHIANNEHKWAGNQSILI